MSKGEVECTVADTTDDCIIKIMVWLFFLFFSLGSFQTEGSVASFSLGTNGKEQV